MPAARKPITGESRTSAVTANVADLANGLPTPQQPTSQLQPPQLLVYDGDCRFCVKRVRWFKRKVPEHSQQSVSAVAWQNLDLGEVGLSERTVKDEAVWIDEENQQHTGSDAVAKSLIHIGGIWGVAGRLMRIPPISWLARLVYRIVAANRHRLGGRNTAGSQGS